MKSYLCVAWVLTPAGKRRAEAKEVIAESELGLRIVDHVFGLSGKPIPGSVLGYAAAGKFAARLGLKPEQWEIPIQFSGPAQSSARIARELPVIIRVEEIAS